MPVPDREVTVFGADQRGCTAAGFSVGGITVLVRSYDEKDNLAVERFAQELARNAPDLAELRYDEVEAAEGESAAASDTSKLSYGDAERAYKVGRLTRAEWVAYVREWRHSTVRHSDLGWQYHSCPKCRYDEALDHKNSERFTGDDSE